MQREDLSTQADPLSCLSGFRLTHVFRLVSKVNLETAAKVAVHLECSNPRVENWTMARSGDVLDHKIEISEVSARALRDELVAIDQGGSVRLEHL